MVAVPEGLPLSVEISLSQATKRMYSREKILVRKLDAPERMGQITQINTGLTGTLTTGEMSVVKFFAQDMMITNSRKDTITNSELTKDI
jgi:Ca2+-transporting ATPase